MEDRQMKKYPLFRKIGAFSINRDDPRKAIASLRYAVQSFQRNNASLFIYPEGTITPAGSAMHFEGGLSWLSQKLPDIDIVPIGIHIHTIRHNKPELHLHIGRPVIINDSTSRDERSRIFEQRLNKMLDTLRKSAGFDDAEFEHFI